MSTKVSTLTNLLYKAEELREEIREHYQHTAERTPYYDALLHALNHAEHMHHWLQEAIGFEPEPSPTYPQGVIQEPVWLAIRCVGCKRTHVVKVERIHRDRWLSANPPLVQELFTDRTGLPYLSADERELLVSRTCGPCYDSLFSWRASDPNYCGDCGEVIDDPGQICLVSDNLCHVEDVSE